MDPPGNIGLVTFKGTFMGRVGGFGFHSFTWEIVFLKSFWVFSNVDALT